MTVNQRDYALRAAEHEGDPMTTDPKAAVFQCPICGAFIKRKGAGKCSRCGADWDNGTTDTPLDLSRYEGAVPGPWSDRGHGTIVGGVVRHYTHGDSQDQIVMVCFIQEENGDRDATIRLVTDAPLLLAKCAALRTQLAERDAEVVALRTLLQRIDAGFGCRLPVALANEIAALAKVTP